jgi:phosphatidylethanolamine/phosphatidyl-N-methylethanolamine N-methyltransferase
MAAAVGLGARSVVEIGAGTGAVTRALVDCVNGERLVVVERNPELHDLLASRFPEVEIVEGDALELVEVVRRSHRAEVGSVDAVVSGLGLLTMTREDQRRLLDQAFQVLKPSGRFVQFTYAPVLPVHRELLAELGLCSRRTAFSLLNIPPASIYVVTRRRRSRRPAPPVARRTSRGRRGA